MFAWPNFEDAPSARSGACGIMSSTDEAAPRGENEALCIVLVGDTLVGKTSFLRRSRQDSSSASDLPPVTIGTNLFNLHFTVDGATTRLEMWDTAGQERYRSIVPMYYRRADAVMIFFDIIDRVSFLHAREWVLEARRCGHRISRMILVANKTDLLAGRGVHRGASELEVRRFVTSFNLLYAEMSVRENRNVQETLEYLVRETLAARNERRRSELAASIVRLQPPDNPKRMCCR